MPTQRTCTSARYAKKCAKTNASQKIAQRNVLGMKQLDFKFDAGSSRGSTKVQVACDQQLDFLKFDAGVWQAPREAPQKFNQSVINNSDFLQFDAGIWQAPPEAPQKFNQLVINNSDFLKFDAGVWQAPPEAPQKFNQLVINIVLVDDFYQLQLWTLESLSILAAQSDIFPFYLPV